MSVTSPEVEALRTDARVRRTLFAVVAVQLAMSIRFFHEYVDAAPWLVYSAFVAGGMVACAVVLRSPALFGVLTRTSTLVVALGCLLALVLVVYPRADALREVGRGSDQDDCVRTLVRNVFELREPFGYGYFGDPCSTGPGEFFIYFPVQVSTGFFVLAPVLWSAIGYWVLRCVTIQPMAVLLTLSLFTSWLFLDMSAVGSDMVAIAWLFAAGAVGCERGLATGRVAPLVWGGFAYIVFAAGRVPLLLVLAGSLLVLLMAAGRRALTVVVPVVLATAALYAGGYALDPDSFTPGHLVGRSLRIFEHMGSELRLLTVGVAVALAVGLAVMASRGRVRAITRRHYYPINVCVIVLPMAAAALWNLSRRDFDLGAWEGLQYLFLAVPTMLVAAGADINAASQSHRVAADR